jgi:hypothetical protein
MICSDFYSTRDLAREVLVISFQSFKERLIQQCRDRHLYLVDSILTRTLLYFNFTFPVFGGAKVQPLFLPTKFFRNFF